MLRRLRRWANRIRYRRFGADLDEELAFHRELKERELGGGPGVTRDGQRAPDA